MLDLAFVRMLKYRRVQVESVFVGCHNIEVFAMPIARRLFFNMLLPVRWMETVECAGIYPILTPRLYIYYSIWTKYAGDVQQRTYNEVRA